MIIRFLKLYLEKIIFLGIILAAFFSYTIPQSFINVDLPRHLKNGQYILTTNSIPQTNLYSYTHTDFPVVTHHWGAGVIFYLIYEIWGFSGVHLFMIGVSLLALGIFYHLATQVAHPAIAGFSGVITLSMISTRPEMRPENFSYLLLALFLVILWQVQAQKWSIKYIYTLPVLMIAWVNLHVFFIFGLFLLGLYTGLNWLKFLGTGIRTKISLHLTIATFASLGASLLNPYFFQGLIAPVTVMTEVQQYIVENLSVLVYLKHFNEFGYSAFIASFLLTGLIIGLNFDWSRLSNVRTIIKNNFSVNYLAAVIILITFAYLGWSMIRVIAIYGLMSLPLMAFFLDQWLNKLKTPAKVKLINNFFKGSLIVLVIFYGFKLIKLPLSDWIRLGVPESVQASGQFLNHQQIPGPILNNFNSGSYLIWHLYPRELVYVDNRSEAYPNEFFYNDYLPLENNPNAWSEIDTKYNFNVIFLETSAQEIEWKDFIQERLNDPEWFQAYQDEYAIILLRNTQRNRELVL